MNTGAFRTMSYNSYQLNNLSSSYLDTHFQQRQYMSDYYLENASFLKMDNATWATTSAGSRTSWASMLRSWCRTSSPSPSTRA